MGVTLLTDLFGYLSTAPGLAALISTRLYPDELPQEATLPAVSYLQVSGVPVVAHDGYVGWEPDHVQFDCFAATPLAAEAVANALRAALIAWRAADSDYAAWEENRQSFPEPELGRYRMTLDAFIGRKG